MPKKTNINRLYRPLNLYEEEAEDARLTFGRTDVHSSGDPIINEYLGGTVKGAYGRERGYEIVLIFGDTGCIAGDAEITFKSSVFVDSRPHKIKLSNLYKRFHGLSYVGWHGGHTHETLWVRSHSGDNLPQWSQVEDVVDKGVRLVKRVHCNGHTVVATPDHKFLTENGWKSLYEIKIGEKVMMAGTTPLYIGGKKRVKSHIVYTKYHPTNSKTVVSGKFSYHVGAEHRLQFEAKMNGLYYKDYIYLLNHYDGRKLWTIPKGMEVHHKDGNHSNNNWSNLELLSKSAHAKLGILQSIDNFDYSDHLEPVEAIEDIGSAHVYDISCKEVHNFVANGFCVHNCNKSTFATQLVLEPLRQGKTVVYFSLEDDPKDLHTRIYQQTKINAGKFQDDKIETRKITPNLLVAADSDGYTLEDMATEIEKVFEEMDADIVVIDPLQFIFEASVVERAETEFNRQRLFLRKMTNLMKRAVEKSGKDKTLLIVSHTNKGNYDNAIDNIMGSGALKQVPTKIIQVGRNKDGTRFIRLWKSRFTKFRYNSLQVTLNENTMTLNTLPAGSNQTEQQWREELRRSWDRPS